MIMIPKKGVIVLLMVAITTSIKVSRAQADKALDSMDCLSKFLSAYRETSLWCGYNFTLESCSTHDIVCKRSATNCQEHDAFRNASVTGEVRFHSLVLVKTIKSQGYPCSCEQYTFTCVIIKDEGSCYIWLTTGSVLFGLVMFICVAIMLYRQRKKSATFHKKYLIREDNFETIKRDDKDCSEKIKSNTVKESIPKRDQAPRLEEDDCYNHLHEEEKETADVYNCYDKSVLKI